MRHKERTKNLSYASKQKFTLSIENVDIYYCTNIFHTVPQKKVMWRSGVILRLCSQKSQAEGVRDPVWSHHLSVKTRAYGHISYRFLRITKELFVKSCKLSATFSYSGEGTERESFLGNITCLCLKEVISSEPKSTEKPRIYFLMPLFLRFPAVLRLPKVTYLDH